VHELSHPYKPGVGLGYCASKWFGHGCHSFFVEKLIVNSFKEFSFTKFSFYDVSYWQRRADFTHDQEYWKSSALEGAAHWNLEELFKCCNRHSNKRFFFVSKFELRNGFSFGLWLFTKKVVWDFLMQCSCECQIKKVWPVSPLHVWIIAAFYKGREPSVVVFQVCEHGKAMEQTFVQIDVCTLQHLF
jgi:hypothetical protein